MRREIFALLLLLLLISASLLNILAADKLRSNILTNLRQAEEAAGEEHWNTAETALDKALNIWLNAERYTHIFIRHSEIDSCSDAFYELKQALLSKSRDELAPVFSKLRYHINSIADMEKISLGSIF